MVVTKLGHPSMRNGERMVANRASDGTRLSLFPPPAHPQPSLILTRADPPVPFLGSYHEAYTNLK